MKSNYLSKIRIPLLLSKVMLLLLLASCNNTVYTYTSDGRKFQPTVPCKVKVVKAVDESLLQEYELIGTCESDVSSGGIRGRKNIAFEYIEECACDKGASLIELVQVEEELDFEKTNIIKTEIRRYNPRVKQRIFSDKIRAKIYRKKT